MLRKLLSLLCALGLALCLCGCNIFTSDTAELLSPPQLTGDLLPIEKAIKKSVKTEYTLEYPSRGDYRSAIIQHDLNKDGTLEAFAFYSTQGRESVMMNINAVVSKKGKWISVDSADIKAGGIDRVEFCDLDGDGIDEILVGWEIYGTTELQLAVYSLAGNKISQKMLQNYTHFTPCDLDADGKSDVFIVRCDPTAEKNTAHLYSLSKEGVLLSGECLLDSTAKTLNHPIVSTLSSGVPAIYIDEIKGVGATTEVIYSEKGTLVNPLLNASLKNAATTLRTATLECRDINEDGILEIPVWRDVPTVSRSSNSERQYLIDWCSFNGEALTVQMTAVMNLSDGYLYPVPQKWMNKIAISRDSDGSLTEIYRYNPKTKTVGERLIYFKTVRKRDWDKGDYATQDFTELVNDGETSFLCCVSAAAESDGITAEKIKTDFKLY